MSIEEEYEDILHNIEYEIVSVYHSNMSLLDYDVEEALEALILEYKAELRGRTARDARIGERGTKVYAGVKEVCNWRLARQELTISEGEALPIPLEPVTVEEIIACLQRIRKSVQKWQREGGRQGYLQFIEHYIA